MKLVARNKALNAYAEEAVSLLPEDPEDMVSSPCSCCLVPSKFIPLVYHTVFPLSTLLDPASIPIVTVTPPPSSLSHPSRSLALLDMLVSSIHLIPHVSQFKPLSVPDATDVTACSYETAR